MESEHVKLPSIEPLNGCNVVVVVEIVGGNVNVPLFKHTVDAALAHIESQKKLH